MVLVKNWTFVQLFFLGKIGRENLFGNVLHIIIAPPDYKNINIKRSQNLHFSMGVSPWFWSKIGHFFNFSFLSEKAENKRLSDLLDIIIAFLQYKNINLKRSQNLHFSKGVSPWFWSKLGHFLNFSF